MRELTRTVLVTCVTALVLKSLFVVFPQDERMRELYEELQGTRAPLPLFFFLPHHSRVLHQSHTWPTHMRRTSACVSCTRSCAASSTALS